MSSSPFDRNRPSLKGKCPFCGGEYRAGYVPPRPGVFWGGHKEDEPVARVEHDSPTCTKFQILPPLLFLQEARLAGAKIDRFPGRN